MKRRVLTLLGAIVILSSCRTADDPAPAAAAPQQSTVTAADAGAELDRLLDAYFEEVLVLNPVFATAIGDNRYNDRFEVTISEEHRARTRAVEEKYLRLAKQIDPTHLTAQRKLSHEIFVRDLEGSLEAYQFPSHLMPLNQFYNTGSSFATMGAGTGLHPFKTVKDYEDFLGRTAGFERWVDTAIANMREGIRAGVVQPRVLMEKTLPQLAAHIVDDPKTSIFYKPLLAFPSTFSKADQDRLTAQYTDVIRQRLVPAYRRLHAFVRDEYLPAARPTVGMSALPNGRAWYDYRVRRTTTTPLTAEQIHEIGLSEVARIHREIDQVRERVGFKGTREEFFRHLASEPSLYFTSREELLESYRQLKTRIDATTPKLFDVIPKVDYEIRLYEPFREQSASSGSYQNAAPDGSRPGVFYVNAYDLKARPRFAMTALQLHEGAPGHHFQISIQQGLESLPRFRRFGGYTAYVEGWGLYAESLGSELGVYDDPYQYYGKLDAELWRAIRLVLDTGIHAKGWTREQAIEYATKNSSVNQTRVVSEVERFIAIPSQALAYKIGQLKISELRSRAERELGSRFDIKAFHRAILLDGALPLDVLERKIDAWIAEQKAAA